MPKETTSYLKAKYVRQVLDRYGDEEDIRVVLTEEKPDGTIHYNIIIVLEMEKDKDGSNPRPADHS